MTRDPAADVTYEPDDVEHDLGESGCLAALLAGGVLVEVPRPQVVVADDHTVTILHGDRVFVLFAEEEE